LSHGAATSASANRIGLAAVRAEQGLGQQSPLDVLNAERELTGTGVKRIEAQRNLARAGCATPAS
jgi:outer membrane protein TolC